MKIILTIEIKPTPKKKKSSAPQKPIAQSDSTKTNIIINNK